MLSDTPCFFAQRGLWKYKLQCGHVTFRIFASREKLISRVQPYCEGTNKKKKKLNPASWLRSNHCVGNQTISGMQRFQAKRTRKILSAACSCNTLSAFTQNWMDGVTFVFHLMSAILSDVHLCAKSLRRNGCWYCQTASAFYVCILFYLASVCAYRYC